MKLIYANYYGRNAKSNLKKKVKEINNSKTQTVKKHKNGKYSHNTLKPKVFFTSYKEPNIHSIFLEYPDGQKYISVKNGKNTILKLFPENEIYYCNNVFCIPENSDDIPTDYLPDYDIYICKNPKINTLLGMRLDREKFKVDKNTGRKRYKNVIKNTPTYKRLINVKKITKNPAINSIAANTLKYVAQDEYATKIDSCLDFGELLEKKYTIFML